MKSRTQTKSPRSAATAKNPPHPITAFSRHLRISEKKTAIPNASRKSGIIFIHCSIAALAATGAMDCPKFSPALDAQASEAVSYPFLGLV